MTPCNPPDAPATILLVDDEPTNLELLQAFLEPEQLGRLVATTDPLEVAELLERQRPDLLVLDLHMPALSGFDILASLRPRRENGDFLPVLVLTADSTPDARQRALAGGASDFLTKPLEAFEVVLRVRNLLETRRLYQQQRLAREEAEEGRQRALLLAEQAAIASRARDRVLSVVAHDLRNPLAAIAADAEMLEQLMPERSGRQRAAASRICRTAARTERHLQDLLDIARLEQDALSLERRPVPVSALAADARELLEPLARARRIELTFAGPADLPPLSVDRGRVQQVLSNLVGNALRFSPEGGRVRISWCQEVGEAVFAVRDEGPGIEPAHMSLLFSPFWQADAAERRGAGLGLVIARALVGAHGGRIWAESTPGDGATFHFTLPFAAEAAPPEGSSE